MRRTTARRLAGLVCLLLCLSLTAGSLADEVIAPAWEVPDYVTKVL